MKKPEKILVSFGQILIKTNAYYHFTHPLTPTHSHPFRATPTHSHPLRATLTHSPTPSTPIHSHPLRATPTHSHPYLSLLLQMSCLYLYSSSCF